MSVLLRHTGGAIAYVDASWRDTRLQTGLEICGTAGLYRVLELDAVGIVRTHRIGCVARQIGGCAGHIERELEASIGRTETGPSGPTSTIPDRRFGAMAARKRAVKNRLFCYTLEI